MNDPELLLSECQTFCRYLVRQDATDYVARSYVEAHSAPALSRSAQGVDRALLRVARWGRWGVALADSYAALFSRTGLLRSKLVLLFGILESTAPFHRELDRVPRGGLLRLIGLGVVGGATGALAVLIFGPLHLVVGRGDA